MERPYKCITHSMLHNGCVRRKFSHFPINCTVNDAKLSESSGKMRGGFCVRRKFIRKRFYDRNKPHNNRASTTTLELSTYFISITTRAIVLTISYKRSVNIFLLIIILSFTQLLFIPRFEELYGQKYFAITIKPRIFILQASELFSTTVLIKKSESDAALG